MEMEGCFQGFNLPFARREANLVAHLCTREALSLNSVALNFDVIADFLTEAVQSGLVWQRSVDKFFRV
jgi:hypothetical protein